MLKIDYVVLDELRTIVQREYLLLLLAQICKTCLLALEIASYSKYIKHLLTEKACTNVENGYSTQTIRLKVWMVY